MNRRHSQPDHFLQWPILSRIAFVACLLALAMRGQSTSTTTANGTTFYVDANSGNDEDAGTTPDTPWKSLDRVNRKVFAAGDVILLKSGSSWTGQLWPKGSGTEQHPIVIDKYGGDAKPIINVG